MRAADPARAGGARWALSAFLVAGLALRLPGHLNGGLWFDEIWLLVESVRVPFGAVLTSFESDNNHPFYTLLAWLSVNAFGEHAWALRLPALAFGVASIGIMWKFALLVTDRAEAALATALLTVSYHHVWFSQNARGYTMLLFWTLAATYLLVQAYRSGARRTWVGYAICLALATYTHASAVLLAVAHGLVSAVVLATGDRGRSVEERWAPFLGLGLAGALSLGLHAGMLAEMAASLTTTPPAAPRGAAQAAASGESTSQWTSLFWTVSAAVESLGVPAALGYASLAGGGLLMGLGTLVVARRDWRHALLYVAPGVIAVAATVALGRSLRPRFLFHLGGFASLVLVAGVFATCDGISRWRLRSGGADPRPHLRRAAALGLIVASLAVLPRAYALPKQDFRGALEFVTSARAAGEAVAATPLVAMPYRRYYGAPLREVASAAELDRLRAENDAVYVLNTIPIYLETTAPDLATRLVDSLEVARFRGSLGDGDIVVYRFEGLSRP